MVHPHFDYNCFLLILLKILYKSAINIQVKIVGYSSSSVAKKYIKYAQLTSLAAMSTT